MGQFSVIAWVNNYEQFESVLLPSLSYALQLGDHEVEVIAVGPEAGCRSMGAAYNLGLRQARYPNKLYAHQDLRIGDDTFLNKIDALLEMPWVGAVGLIGAREHTGALYSMNGFDNISCVPDPVKAKVGFMGWWSDSQVVATIDGVFMATRSNEPFDPNYIGTHMVIEDYATLLQSRGKKIFTVDSRFDHLGGAGAFDEGYWESVKRHRRKWRAYYAQYPSIRPVSALKEDMERARGELARLDRRMVPAGIDPGGLDRLRKVFGVRG